MDVPFSHQDSRHSPDTKAVKGAKASAWMDAQQGYTVARQAPIGKSVTVHGEQKVYISTTDAQGHWLGIFPNGAGYSCAPTAQWARGAFALTVPPGTTALTIWLRATGNGSAAFKDVTLQPAR